MRPLAAHAASPGAAGQAARAPSGRPNSAKIRGLLPKGVATFRNWLPRNGVCWPEGNRQERDIAACADASLGVACRAKGTRQRNGQETRPETWRCPDDIVSASDFRADTALSADRAPGPGADAGFEGPVPRAGNGRAQPARQSRGGALHAAADRPVGRAHRALPRSAALASADGRDLPAADRRGRAMAEGGRPCGAPGRCAGPGFGAAALGSERQGARRLPAGRRDDERAYRVDRGDWRRLCDAAGRGHGAGPGIAPARDEIRQAEAGEAPAGAPGRADHHYCLGGAGPGLCAGL